MIVDKDQELRGWKSHCVELQNKVDRLELENSRLQAAIDAANAQEPVDKQYRYPIGLSNGVQQWTSWGSWIGGECMRDAQERKLYARPIPAQQSIEQAHMAGQADAQEPVYQWRIDDDEGWIDCTKEWFDEIYYSHENRILYASQMPSQQQKCNSGTNEYGLDIGYMAGKLNLFLRDISRHKPSEAARVLARLALVADDSIFSEPEFAQQSQAVAVPDECCATGESCVYEVCTLNGEQQCKYCGKEHPDMKSPRITEQDAREIVTAWAKYVDDHDETVAIPDFEWSHHEWKFILRAILNKLNEAKNG